MRGLGDAYVPIVERYGTEFAFEERERFAKD
jgi:tRNA(Met) cytidine acetyltransferase